jgi:hypothetical protein
VVRGTAEALKDRWIFSARWIEDQIPRATWRFTLTYRLLPTFTAGAEYNPKVDEVAPLANWLAIQESARRPALMLGTSTDRIGTPSGQAYYATLSKNLQRLLHAPIAPYAGAAYGTFDDRLRFIGGVNLAVTPSLSALVTYNGEHYNSIISLSRGRYTGSLLYVSGGDIGAAWNVTW